MKTRQLRALKMKNIPEINHCSPKSRAYWCYRCKSHNTFNHGYSCKDCGASMFCPAATMPWMIVLCGIGFPLLVFGVGIILIGGGDAGLMCLLIGAFPALVGGMMLYHLRSWFAWSSAQRSKSRRELDLEAMDHPFQPVCEDTSAFRQWAKQFLSSRKVSQLCEKYSSAGPAEEREARISLRVEGEIKPPPPPEE